MISKSRERTTIFALGALGYTILEICWRGRTHWTMSLTGGLCFLLIYLVDPKFSRHNLLVRCTVIATIITSMEFIVGCIVNLGFRWDIWDYSDFAFHMLGQICPFSSMLWLLLAFPCLAISTWLSGSVFSDYSTERTNSVQVKMVENPPQISK